jgi:hypothetical protein
MEHVTSWILKVAVTTLAVIILVVVAVLMVGIFMPNDVVDNKEIFSIIGPAFNTVIGAFVGLLGGISLSQSSSNSNSTSTPPRVETTPSPDPVPTRSSEEDSIEDLKARLS